MKTKYFNLLPLLGLSLLVACGETSESEKEQNNENAELNELPTNAIVENEEPEEEALLAFDGIEKGEYTLYGHTEIEKNGNEISREEMFTKLIENGEFKGEVLVNIDEVCQKAGCWVTFENGEEEPVRVFFRDHFTIPTETASGTEAVLYGELVRDTMTVEFQKHLLDDAAEGGKEVSQEEYDAITEDVIETTFDCESILVKR